jgi:hypothetical protein
MLGLSCFIYVMLRPVSSNKVLVPVLALLGLTAVGSLLTNGLQPAHGFLPILGVQLIAGVLALLVGSVNDTPGLWSDSRVLVAAPILFWVCVFALRPWMLRPLLIAAALGTALVSTGILLFVLGDKGLLPQVLPAAAVEGSGAAVGGGDSIQLRFYGLSTLVAAGPMWIASLLIHVSDVLPPMWLRLYAATAALLAGMVSGRRILILLLLLTPVLLWLVRRLLITPSLRRAKDRTSLILPALLSLVVGLAIAFAAAPSVFSPTTVRESAAALSDTLGGGGAYNDDIRTLESDGLLQGWAKRPLLGYGAGAVLPGYARNDLRPWDFELQYHRLLLQEGLVGAVCFLAVLVLSVRVLRRAVYARPECTSPLLATTVGSAAMLVANASDPYLQAPGHMWAIYLPLGVASALLSNANATAAPFDYRDPKEAITSNSLQRL